MSKSIENIFHMPQGVSVKKLTDDQYANDHVIWAAATKQRVRMVPLAVSCAIDKLSGLNSIKVLGVGCGAGLFEIPFLESLAKTFSKVHFTGIDPNEILLNEFYKNLSILKEKAPNVSVELKLGVLEDLDQDEKFDLINLTQILFYIQNIPNFIKKNLLHLTNHQKGVLQIFHPPKGLICQLFEAAQIHCLKQKEPLIFSEDLDRILREIARDLNYHIDRQKVTYSDDSSHDPWVDLTPISSLPLSSQAKAILSFLIGVEFTSLPNEIQQRLRNFLLSEIQKSGRTENGHLYLPIPVDFYQISRV